MEGGREGGREAGRQEGREGGRAGVSRRTGRSDTKVSSVRCLSAAT